MKNSTRKKLDTAFGIIARASLAFVLLLLCAFIIPIVVRGIGAVMFTATVEHEKFASENLGTSIALTDMERIRKSDEARAKIYQLMDSLENGGEDFRKRLEAKLASSMSKASENSVKIAEAAAMPQAERKTLMDEISENIWKDFISELDSAEYDAVKKGNCVPLAKSLEVFGEKLGNSVSEFVSADSIISKCTVLKRSFIKRAISRLPSEKIELALERLAKRNGAYLTLKDGISELFGPRNEHERDSKNLIRQKYGQTRFDIARKILSESVMQIRVSDRDACGREIQKVVKSEEYFAGTPVEKIVKAVSETLGETMKPHTVFYWGFLTDNPIDANIFGGIFPMIAGTFYLTVGAMLIAAPLGIVSAVYFSEYAGNGRIVEILRMCVGTLAGVPSIVFGLFGLAFLINTLKISEGKSVLAGAITLALLILPTIIRSCEESLKAVPNSYREAALGLGAGKWRVVCGVVIPAAIPSMLTGIIISMGRAAGETAPIIFTAATSTGVALGLGEILTQPTTALPWNIYNICSEHEMAERVQHVQYGMVLTLVLIVALLNAVAIWLRIKLQNKTK